ncbi:MAG: VWA domain-containing protein [Candidatus Omnitrophica bacterium]|nr:VWA domain-containing protein [Candidatus Omnitrophota bacterium]
MTLAPLVVPVMCGVAVLWLAQRIPLSGWRKRAVVACRLIAVGALCAALLGATYRQTETRPRRLVYLVDASASIDARQRDWMAARIASLETLRPRRMPRAIVVFGSDTRLAAAFDTEPLTDPVAIRRLLTEARVDPQATNLETALLSSFTLLGSAQHDAAILLTDGRETTGNVTGVLAAVRRLGLEVFPVAPPLVGSVKTVWDELAVSPTVQRGSPVPVQLVVLNGAPRAKTGQVTISMQGVEVKRQRVTVRPGWQVFSLSVPAIARGTMALDVRLTIPDEGIDEQRRAYTEVEGPPQLLFVTDRTTAVPVLAEALKHRQIEVASIRLADLPVDVHKLLDYDAVVLSNVAKSAVSTAAADTLRTYVSHFGGGLVTVGLGGDLAREMTAPSPLDALLPITFEPKGLQEAKRRVCMILLIDRSASMVGPRIAATKRASVALVKQLSPEDLVGILAFDTQPYIVAEVGPASHIGPSLIDKLVKLHASGGTDVYPALVAADNRLELTGATLKHIILLSDGYTPINEKAYEALLQAFHLSGTSISTIGVGSAFINVEYLKWLAQSTGGSYYEMRSLDELPQLVARDTQQQLGRLPFTEGYFRPVKSPTTDWFAETTTWPSLKGYLTSTAKPESRVDLTVNGGEGDDPLLARWMVGQGRVVSFTSDADVRWAPEWIRWPGFEATWAQVVRWAMRPRPNEELFVWMDQSQGAAQLVVEGALQDPRATLIAGERDAATPLALVQSGTWRWRASLEQIPSGWYQLTLESHEGTAPIFTKRWVQIGTPPTIGEGSGQPPREALLQQIAKATSGVYGAPDRALVPPTVVTTVTRPLMMWWLPLVILALLIDVALRGSSML